MRVVHVIPTLAASHGGPSEVVKQLLALNPHSSVVTTDRGAGPGEFDAFSDRVRLCRPLPPRRLNLARGVGAALDAGGPIDVVHLHSVNSAMTSIAARWCIRRRIPFVLQPHGAYDAYHAAQNRLLKRAYNFVDRPTLSMARTVIVSSRREEEGAARELRTHFTRIALGVDRAIFETASPLHKTKTVLFLGRVAQKKRVDLAIRAFASSRAIDKGWRLVVAGPIEGGLNYDPVELAAELGASSHVLFVGAVDGVVRNSLLAGAAAFLLPSEDESFGVAAAEAMAAGCACVLSRDVGLAEDYAHTGAFATSSREVAELASSLDQLLEPRECERQGVLARGVAERHFTWEAIGRELAKVYVSAVENRSKGTA